MRRVLLTGARAAAPLELARLFHAAGWRVVVAESLSWHAARFSLAVYRSYPTPWPNRDPDGFIGALLRIVRREGIDLIVPTCEEIFWVARGRDRLAPYCRVFTEDMETLRSLHSKQLFADKARRHGLRAPATTRLTTAAEAREAVASGRDLVFKPEYSRFGSRTLIKPRAAGVDRIDVSERRPWVVQDFVPGRLLCTYSVAHAGRLAVHAAYAAEYTFGPGAAVAFAALDHPATLAWVEAFVRAEGFTGQIAFDFIETAAGEAWAVECNPRATSGVHLFAENRDFVPAFLGERPGRLWPRPGAAAQYPLLTAAYGWRAFRSWPALRCWAAMLLGGRDVFFRGDDPAPGLGQYLTLTALAARGSRHSLSLTEAATLDLEWNGE